MKPETEARIALGKRKFFGTIRHDHAIALMDEAFGLGRDQAQLVLERNPEAKAIYNCAIQALMAQMIANAGGWQRGRPDCPDCMASEDGPACTMNCSGATYVSGREPYPYDGMR